MAIRLITGLESVNWHELAVVFERAPLGQREPEILRQTFQNSSVRCFVYENSVIIGAGRALTDFINWAVIFDVVLLPEHQGFGHGRAIMQSLVEQSKARNVMLHSAPGQEGFYECLGYRRMKTAMALFANPERAQQLKYIEWRPRYVRKTAKPSIGRTSNGGPLALLPSDRVAVSYRSCQPLGVMMEPTVSDVSNTPAPLQQWERPPGTPAERMSRYIASTLGKGLLYALSFWAVYAFVYTPMYYVLHSGDQSGSAEAHSEMQMKAWDDQAKRSAEMLHEGELMQKRYDAIMTKQEQQVERLDAVISAWERQSGVKK